VWDELDCALDNKGVFTGPCFTLYHSAEPQWEVDVYWALMGKVQPSGLIKLYELPGVETMASVVHIGPFIAIGEAYKAIIQWIEERLPDCWTMP
jgi:effector-binding domain-containing protein